MKRMRRSQAAWVGLLGLLLDIRRRRLARTLLVALFAALGAPALSPADDDSDSESEGRIVFACNATGDVEVFVMNSDGSDPINLTNTPGSDLWPAWAPDGRKIVFTRGRGFLRELWVMNADGTDQIRLTTNARWPTSRPRGRPTAGGSRSCASAHPTSVSTSG